MVWFPALIFGGLGLNWQASKALDDVDGNPGSRTVLLDSRVVFSLGWIIGVWMGVSFGPFFERWWNNIETLFSFFGGGNNNNKKKKPDDERQERGYYDSARDYIDEWYAADD